MTFVSRRHEFKEKVILEIYDEVYSEPRPYISGGFFLFFGSVETTYKKDLISYKERKVSICGKCGHYKENPIHNLVVYADRMRELEN